MNDIEQIKAMLAEDPELLAQMMGGQGQLGPPLPGGAGMPMDVGMAECPPGEMPMGGAGGAPVDPMQQEALMRALMQQGPPGPPMR